MAHVQAAEGPANASARPCRVLLQTSLPEHAAAHNLRTVMTFHQRVEEAAAFAEKLPETTAELMTRRTIDFYTRHFGA